MCGQGRRGLRPLAGLHACLARFGQVKDAVRAVASAVVAQGVQGGAGAAAQQGEAHHRWALAELLVKPLFPIISHKVMISSWPIVGKSGFTKSSG